jgi:hypothetical protein
MGAFVVGPSRSALMKAVRDLEAKAGKSAPKEAAPPAPPPAAPAKAAKKAAAKKKPKRARAQEHGNERRC